MPLGYLNSGERTGSCLRCKKVYVTRSTSRKYCSDQCRLEYDPSRRWKAHLKHKYHTTPEQYEEMSKTANGSCQICGRHVIDDGTKSGRKKGMNSKLHLDHDHETGVLRGLLCSSCNKGLGHFRDSVVILRSALQYLERFK